MNRLSLAILFLTTALVPPTSFAADNAQGREKVRVLLVTGGHDYETNAFVQVFKDNPAIVFECAVYPKAQELFKPGLARKFDVLVAYDMWQDMGDEAKAGLIEWCKQGKGLLAMHHCLASFPNWEEYPKIIGGKYHQKPWTHNGAQKPASTYKHDVDFRVKVLDAPHPVTHGVSDFDIHDETYGGFEVRPGSHPLLGTDHPTSGPTIAWTTTYEAARVVYLQLGHDHFAYENPNYRKIVSQAIQWVAKRD